MTRVPGRLVRLCLALLALASCAPRWELSVRTAAGSAASVTGGQWRDWVRAYPGETMDRDALALERVLWEAGAASVESIEVGGQRYDWAAVRADAWLTKRGELQLGAQALAAGEVLVTPPELAVQVRVRLTDVAPTVAGALGVRSPRHTSGRALAAYTAECVIVVAIDGLSYLAFRDISGQGVARVLDSLGAPKLTLSAYPSAPGPAMEALLRGSYATEAERDAPETLFDVLNAEGKTGVAVLSRETTVDYGAASRLIVAPDGAAATEATLDAALEALASDSPALLWVHLDSLRRAAEAHDLGTEAVTAELEALDLQLGRLVSAAPPGSLLIVLGTAGVHPDPDGQGVADSTLLASDMLVPLWVAEF
ncbi:MAG: hypothetical protein GX557_05240 [Chloroflexi bacterium]|nr:hypothetical protein [Chloroflexota bacterium]